MPMRCAPVSKSSSEGRFFSDSSKIIPRGQGSSRVIVIDANVAAKWYLPEAGTDAALELFSALAGYSPPT